MKTIIFVLVCILLYNSNVIALDIWTQERLDDYFIETGNTIQFESGDHYFVQDPPGPQSPVFYIPGDALAEEENNMDDTYTLEFQPGAKIYFVDGDPERTAWSAGGGIIFRSIEVQGGDAVGRINAHGDDGMGEMVKFVGGRYPHEGPVEGIWDGIEIWSDPPSSENIMSYCEILEVKGGNSKALFVNGTNDGDDPSAQLIVSNCYFHDNQNGAGSEGAILVHGPDVECEITDNEIATSGFGIIIGEGMTDGDELLIKGNYIHDGQESGIACIFPFKGLIVNNIIESNLRYQISLSHENEELVANNILDGYRGAGNQDGARLGIGIGEYTETFRNNIILNCSVGVKGPELEDPAPEVDYCLFNNVAEEFEDSQEGYGCIIDEDPDFVGGGDYHLDPDSPCIDAGTSSAGNNIDLNFTWNDMGIYGGQYADPEMAEIYFGRIVHGSWNVEVDAVVPEDYTLVADLTSMVEGFPQEMVLKFNTNTELCVEGTLEVTGQSGYPVVFKANSSDWDGIKIYGNANISYAQIEDGSEWGIAVDGSHINIEDSEIYNNVMEGIVFFDHDFSTSYITDCHIHNNGWDGISFQHSTGGCVIDGNTIEDNGHCGLLAEEIGILSSDNVYRDNGRYGVYLEDNTLATFIGDIIDWNGPNEGNDYAGMGVLDATPSLDDTWIRYSMGMGMEILGTSQVDMDNEVENAIKQSGWTTPFGIRPFSRVDDIEEIWLSSNADVFLADGHNDIYDSLGVDDLLMTRQPNVFQIDGTENFWLMAVDQAFSPNNLVDRADEPVNPYTLAGFDEGASADEEFDEARKAIEAEEYEDALDILMEIVSEKPNSRGAANAPMQMLLCIKKLDSDLGDFKDNLMDLDIDEDNTSFRHNRDIVVNKVRLSLGEYKDAIDDYIDMRDNAECREDSILMVIRILKAERRQAGNSRDRTSSLQRNDRDETMELLSLLHNKDVSQSTLPSSKSLLSSYPNPFNSMARVSYKLDNAGPLTVAIIDITGREVERLHEGVRGVGIHNFTWNAEYRSSGIYFARIETNSSTEMIKMTLVR